MKYSFSTKTNIHYQLYMELVTYYKFNNINKYRQNHSIYIIHGLYMYKYMPVLCDLPSYQLKMSIWYYTVYYTGFVSSLHVPLTLVICLTVMFSPAVLVRFLTKRFIGEYASTASM